MALDPPPAGARAGLLGGLGQPQKTHQRAARRRCAGRPLGGWWPPLGRAVAPARCAALLLIVTFVRRRLV